MRIRYSLFILLLLAALVSPAAAQPAETLIVSTGGIEMTIDKDFASGVSINLLPADDPAFGPGFAEPASVQIAFSNPPPGFARESILTLRFYRVGDFAGYPEHEARLAQLRQLVQGQPADLSAFMEADATLSANLRLPFIPVYTHGAALQARVEPFETPMFRGVRYVAAFAAALEPFTSTSFLYTYQGISNDSSVYLSAQAFIETPLFPTELTAIDPEAFSASFPQYLADSIAALNAAAPTDFSPGLADVDAAIQSITVTPVMQ
jgi:hypothetical protein